MGVERRGCEEDGVGGLLPSLRTGLTKTREVGEPEFLADELDKVLVLVAECGREIVEVGTLPAGTGEVEVVGVAGAEEFFCRGIDSPAAVRVTEDRSGEKLVRRGEGRWSEGSSMLPLVVALVVVGLVVVVAGRK